MPSADPRAAEIVKAITDFEASVASAETALVSRDWPQVDALLSDQRRLTHALANLLEATQDERPVPFTEEVQRRIRQIVEKRADQMRRLVAFNHLVTSRLAIIARSRAMRRVTVEMRGASQILDTHR